MSDIRAPVFGKRVEAKTDLLEFLNDLKVQHDLLDEELLDVVCSLLSDRAFDLAMRARKVTDEMKTILNRNKEQP